MWGHVTKFWNFWTTLMTRERLKQETSNLARRRTAVSSNETNSKLGQKGSCGVTWPIFGILGLNNISRTVKATNFKYGTEIDGGELTKKKFNIGSNGVMWGSRHPILEFWDPQISLEQLKLETSNLARRRRRWVLTIKIQNCVKRVMWGHVTHFRNFGTQLRARERLKLETSNLARRRKAVSSNEKNAKLGQSGSCGGHVTQFWNFGTPLISREGLKLET